MTVHVAVPRDERRPAGLAERGLRAEFRPGGVSAELHPGEAELAAARELGDDRVAVVRGSFLIVRYLQHPVPAASPSRSPSSWNSA
ncbi:hypothetical protein [Prauserella halophila]|uniref:hypothetical protein n=1 Tax=Prauserella halophila TaxID=185641 RepID=UPI0020A412E2|nr:hypothetical protein [Prauserella halophila]MCP2237093.1 hypothetical protein [Prauserella halophila]